MPYFDQATANVTTFFADFRALLFPHANAHLSAGCSRSLATKVQRALNKGLCADIASILGARR
ncbi:hypothetical protein H4V96_002556 [Janthinobacterium sp. CG_23.4]|nr:hypothetical protein [Janthinobacterium sp. CG_23.4]